MFGFLNVYKPVGMTSFDVVARLRRVTHVRQIGHTGTLDPFAQGVLPICIGKTTKLIEYLSDDKAYLATIQFGAKTDTYDKEGQILQRYDNKITQSQLENALKIFEGEIEQKPPIYSAIKVNGKKLYDYARAGENVEIKSRKIKIYKIELRSFDEENQSAEIYIECSKGTYIRSIANDLGENLLCGAYLTDLVRTKAGSFLVENAVKLEDLISEEIVKQHLLNPLDFLKQKKYILNYDEKERVSHGMSVENKIHSETGEVVILVYSDNIYAIGITDNNRILTKKVLEVL